MGEPEATPAEAVAKRSRVHLNRAAGDARKGNREAAVLSCYRSLEAGHKYLLLTLVETLDPPARQTLRERLESNLERKIDDMPRVVEKLSLDLLFDCLGALFEIQPNKETSLRRQAPKLYPALTGHRDFIHPKEFDLVQQCRNRSGGHDNPDNGKPHQPARVLATELGECLKSTAGFLLQLKVISQQEFARACDFEPFEKSLTDEDVEEFEDVSATLPPASYSHFVGKQRAHTLEEAVAALPRWPIVSIVGLGGMGKSALARELALRAVGNSSQFRKIVWLSCKRTEFGPMGERALSADVTCIEDILGAVTGSDYESQRLKEDLLTDTITQIGAGIRSENLLLVLDSLEDLEDSRAERFLNELCHYCNIVITSRERLLHSATFKLDEMSLDELKEVVHNESKTHFGLAATQFDKLALKIAESSGGIPLVTRSILWDLEGGKVLEDILEDLKQLPVRGVENYCYGRIVENLSPDEQLALFAIAQLGGKAEMRFLCVLLRTDMNGINKVIDKLERYYMTRRPKYRNPGEDLIVSIDGSIRHYVKTKLEKNPRIRERIKKGLEEFLQERTKEDELASGHARPQESYAVAMFLPGASFPGEEKIRQYRQRMPRDPYIFYWWANYYQKNVQDLATAAEVLDMGIREFPGNYYLSKRRGIIAKLMGNYPGALQHLLIAKASAVDRFLHCVPLGQTLIHLGRPLEAIDEFELVLDHPNSTVDNKRFALAGIAEATFRYLEALPVGREKDGWEQANMLEYYIEKSRVPLNAYVWQWSIPVFARAGVMHCKDGNTKMGHSMLHDSILSFRANPVAFARQDIAIAEAHLRACKK